MKQDRGKAAAVDTTYGHDNNFSNGYLPCRKHPCSSSVGICSYCLNERLVNLLCSECGEQKLSSSSSCIDDINSSSVDVGSVGRISFLLENEKNDEKTEQVILLRSSSNRVEIKKNDQNGFWKIKRLFRKKKEKGHEKSDFGVSRSRSLCSFRNVGVNETEEEYRFSSAKISDVTTRGLFFDSDEPRKSEIFGDFKNSRKSFPSKESEFRTNMDDDDDSAFIDLKLDLSEPKLEFSESAASMGNLRSGSCRMKEVNEYDEKMKRGNKVWKWIFRQTSSAARRKSTSNIDENSNFIIKS